ncbi:unnamed protein product [Diplocarpon coronariae]
MGPSLNTHPSFVRPRTSDREGRPGTRDQSDHNLIIPSRTSSLHSRITQPIPSTLSVKPQQRTPKTLTHAYMVCGVGREPSQWVKAPPPAQGKIGHIKGAVGQFWLPEILGSSPRMEQDNEIARALHSAMRACFPHDVEICTGRSQPHCVHHSFVLQQDSSHTLYGIALRVWSRADEKRAETIRDLRRRTEPDFYDASDETYWIPYCLSFLSRYPLYNLLGDYLRGMWIHWNKATNLFHAEEVSRILSFPAPRLNDLVRIDMKDYALCYQFPSSPTGFQNFAMWPLFSCLSVPNIVGVVEAALSPTRRIVFVSHYPAMLTVAAETIRYCVRVYEWSGLYVPVVHARHAGELVQEPGPYILGITAECRSLFTAPTDALVVDLDRNFVLTSSPPTALTPGQRTKMISRMTQALNGDVTPAGVPQHLRSAYGGGKLIPAGQIIVMRGEVESIQDPEWWNQDSIMAVMDHVCEKMFLKFQAFAEQLTKETQDLKVKIENHKRENRRLSGLIDQQKDDAARLGTRLAGTEKQRDDALEALVLQQEIAEELERERKRNQKELAALQHTNVTILRQRDEAQRVVLHLRALISGQTHHMEHIVRTLGKSPELVEYIEHGYEEEEAELEDIAEEGKAEEPVASPEPESRASSRAYGNSPHGADMGQGMEDRLHKGLRNSKRYSQMSIVDVADRHLKDKTDAIAHIIRNISEQCAAAVEGLQLAHDAEVEAEELALKEARGQHREHRGSHLSTLSASDDGNSNGGSENGDDSSLLPSDRASSIPPTPDLIHNRSSTSMSIASTTTTPERSSQQYNLGTEIPTKIVEGSDEELEERSGDERRLGGTLVGKPNKLHGPASARLSAFGR